MEQRLYVVYGENDSVYLVKAQNKKEAIDFAHKSFGYGELKKNFTARDIEKDIFADVRSKVAILV